VNHNQPSRPFLRLFSALQSTVHPAESSEKTASTNAVAANNVAGKVHQTSSDQHHDSKRQSKPLHSDDKMIAGSVGPRTIGPRSVDCSSSTPRRVEVSLAEIAPVLADAINHQRGWLSDFSDDTVSIDADLYEVLLAYQQMRRLNAA